MGGLICGVCCKLFLAYMALATCFSCICLVVLQGHPSGNTKLNVARKAAELRVSNVEWIIVVIGNPHL